MMLQRSSRRSRGIAAMLSALLLGAAPFARGDDPRLTIAEVERVSGIKGLQILAPAAVPGAGPGLNFAGPDKKMVLMVNFGTADLYQHAKNQQELKTGGMTIPMPLFHAALPGIGDEAFDSPPGPLQYVIYLRKGQQAASLTTYFTRGGKTTVLSLDQLKQLAAIVASRL
jgi:hypothetical protein